MNIATTTCNNIGSSTVCINELPNNFLGGFSYGESMIIFMLILIFTLAFFKIFIKK